MRRCRRYTRVSDSRCSSCQPMKLGVSYSIDQYGPGEVVREEVHALARQVARELVHRHELGMRCRPRTPARTRRARGGGPDRRPGPRRRAAGRAPPTRAANGTAGRARAARAGSSFPSGAGRRRTAARRSARAAMRGRVVPRAPAAAARSAAMRSTSARVDDAAEQVQLGLRVDRRRAGGGTSRSSPASRPRRGRQAGAGLRRRRAARRDRGRRRPRVADGLAEQVEAADPVGVCELLDHAAAS